MFKFSNSKPSPGPPVSIILLHCAVQIDYDVVVFFWRTQHFISPSFLSVHHRPTGSSTRGGRESRDGRIVVCFNQCRSCGEMVSYIPIGEGVAITEEVSSVTWQLWWWWSCITQAVTPSQYSNMEAGDWAVERTNNWSYCHVTLGYGPRPGHRGHQSGAREVLLYWNKTRRSTKQHRTDHMIRGTGRPCDALAFPLTMN